MNLTPFLASLMPTFTKDTLESEFSELQKLITTVNLPVLENAVKHLGKMEFQSKLVDNMEFALVNDAKMKKEKNFLHMFLTITKAQNAQLPILDKMVDGYFDEDITHYNLTLQRVNVLRYIPVMMFVATYIRTFVNYAISLEVNEQHSDGEETFVLIPHERDWLSKHKQTFISAVYAITKPGSRLEKLINDLPDVAIDPNTVKIVEQAQGQKADPLQLNLIPTIINPFFWVGKAIVNYQVSRYHGAKEELRVLEMKVYNLKQINEGRNDAKLQKEIKYTEEKRVIPLKRKIMEMEENYG